jgi:hypothetical protein
LGVELREGMDYKPLGDQKLLFITCEQGNKAQNQTLLQCAQYRVQKHQMVNRHVVFVVQLPRVTKEPFTGYIVSDSCKVTFDIAELISPR